MISSDKVLRTTFLKKSIEGKTSDLHLSLRARICPNKCCHGEPKQHCTSGYQRTLTSIAFRVGCEQSLELERYYFCLFVLHPYLPALATFASFPGNKFDRFGSKIRTTLRKEIVLSRTQSSPPTWPSENYSWKCSSIRKNLVNSSNFIDLVQRLEQGIENQLCGRHSQSSPPTWQSKNYSWNCSSIRKNLVNSHFIDLVQRLEQGIENQLCERHSQVLQLGSLRITRGTVPR